MNNKIIKFIFTLIVILFIIWFIYFINTENNTEKIKVGVIAPLTGPLAFAGEIIKTSIDIALKESGNSKIEIIYEDGQFDPKKTVDAYQSLKVRGVNYYIIDGSPAVAAVRQQIEQDGNFVIAQAATTPNYYDGINRTCRIALTARTFGPAISNYMIKKVENAKVAFLVPNNEYGKGMTESISNSLKQSSGNVTIEEFYPTDSQDFRTNIAKIKSLEKETDFLFIINNASTVEVMLNQIKSYGWNKEIVSDIWTMRNSQLRDEQLKSGIVFADYDYKPTIQPNDSNKVRNFKTDYKEKTGGYPVYLAAATYDSIMLLSEAFDEVDKINTETVADYISSLENYNGLSGTLSFDSDCEVSRNVIFNSF
jgi:branched-chain amino acid transport system substrate-binding protein